MSLVSNSAVLRYYTVSEENIASIIRVEELSTRETDRSRRQMSFSSWFLFISLFDFEEREDMSLRTAVLPPKLKAI
jgi:hypothetical protein